MSERIAAAVWEKPRRRFGLGAVLAAFGLAVVLLVSGMSGSSNAASTRRHAAAGAHARQVASASQQQSINAKVNAPHGRS